jgi:hypothetical protein
MYDRIRVCTDEGVWRDVKIGSDEHINSKGYNEWLEEQQKKENQLKINTMQKAKITNIQGSGTWNEMFKFEVTMENGDVGTVFSKSQQPLFKVGDYKSYEITPSGRGYKIKWVQEQRAFTPSSTGNSYQANNSKDKEESIARAVALKASVDMGHSDNPAKVIEVAQLFEKYLTTGQSFNDDAKDNLNSNSKMDSNDDLPF